MADCVERGCGVGVSVAMEEWLAGGKVVCDLRTVVGGLWRIGVVLVLLRGRVCKGRGCYRSLDVVGHG